MPETSYSSWTSDRRLRGFAAFAILMLGIFLFALILSTFKSMQYIGSGVAATNTISVTGTGDMFAVPDTAEFTVTIDEKGKDVPTAQTAATTKGNAVIAYLKGQGIDQKDIQTTNYSVNPTYEYQNASCAGASGGAPVYCPPGRQILTGYEVSQSLTVKVRDTQKAGAILSGVGGLGASNVSGLNFTVADQDLVEAQARDKAIADAKAKAETLAKSLGVKIVRVVGFSENQNYPVYAKSYALDSAAGSAAVAPSPEIPTGQNKITSNVSVTYEIK